MSSHQFLESVVAINLQTSDSINSAKDITLLDCPKLGHISALGNIILINCPDHGKVSAGGNIHSCDSNNSNLHSKGELLIYNTKHMEKTISKFLHQEQILEKTVKISD
ncbi:MAG: hypothetical protein H0X29_04525 [Parachlamydiaceae bacterium]|nr:hypothetical protein [Parachlamydiaceae bacterium]